MDQSSSASANGGGRRRRRESPCSDCATTEGSEEAADEQTHSERESDPGTDGDKEHVFQGDHGKGRVAGMEEPPIEKDPSLRKNTFADVLAGGR